MKSPINELKKLLANNPTYEFEPHKFRIIRDGSAVVGQITVYTTWVNLCQITNDRITFFADSMLTYPRETQEKLVALLEAVGLKAEIAAVSVDDDDSLTYILLKFGEHTIPLIRSLTLPYMDGKAVKGKKDIKLPTPILADFFTPDMRETANPRPPDPDDEFRS